MTAPSGKDVPVPRKQAELLAGALDGLLALLVEDWRADAPVARDPWEHAGLTKYDSHTTEVWGVIEQARVALSLVLRQNPDLTLAGWTGDEVRTFRGRLIDNSGGAR